MSTATFNVCASTLIKHLIIANMILKAKNMQLLALFESSEVHVNWIENEISEKPYVQQICFS